MEQTTLDLCLFGGDGGAAAGAGDAAAEQATAEAARPAPSREDAFNRLISGEYREEYVKRTQQMIDTRFKQSKELEGRMNSLRPVLEALAARYGMDAAAKDFPRQVLRAMSAEAAPGSGPDGAGGRAADASSGTGAAVGSSATPAGSGKAAGDGKTATPAVAGGSRNAAAKAAVQTGGAADPGESNTLPKAAAQPGESASGAEPAADPGDGSGKAAAEAAVQTGEAADPGESNTLPKAAAQPGESASGTEPAADPSDGSGKAAAEAAVQAGESANGNTTATVPGDGDTLNALADAPAPPAESTDDATPPDRPEVTRLLRRLRAQQTARFIHHTGQRWQQEAQALAALYPGFSLAAEVNGPRGHQLLGMLKSGVPMRIAYQALHMDELLPGALRYAVEQTRQRTVEDIRARGLRPEEAAAGSQTAAAQILHADPSRWDAEEMNSAIQQARMGKKIYL
ncbi:MAG: hypothetical protein E7320_02065 [Clostridiales bacterium]|nr:hypothetical protein [Clostridiales bacterium]